jgi:phosphonate transport system substrate-binding protein
MRKLTLLICLVFLIISGCGREKPKEISIEKMEPVQEEIRPPYKTTLRFAVGAMLTPEEGFAYYKSLLNYVQDKSDMHVKYVDKKSYAEINALLREGKIDIAFVCSGPYVEGRDWFGLDILVVPQAYGRTVYYSYIIAHKDSPIKSLHDLKGKIFAFTDPLSNTGRTAPAYMLSKMNETPDSFFGRYIFTGTHDKSIKAVAMKIVDGAAVDSIIYDYMARNNSELTANTKIVLRSQPFGIPPVAVRPGLPADTKQKLKNILLDMHKDEKGREILKGMMIDRFVEGSDNDYDSIREMKAFIKSRKSDKNK